MEQNVPTYFFLLFENRPLMKRTKEISVHRGKGYEKILYYPAGTNRKKTAKFIIQNWRYRSFTLHSLLHLVVCANGPPHFGRSERNPLGGAVRPRQNLPVRWAFHHWCRRRQKAKKLFQETHFGLIGPYQL